LEEHQKILALKLIAGDKAWGQPEKADLEKVEAHRGPVTLGRSTYPPLVTFADITIPSSVSEVKPEDLAATFGSGYSLRSITLEITDEEVTKGRVGKVLAFISEENPIFIDWTKYPPGHVLRELNRRYFLTGN
jgi:hypothetical protein